MSHSSISVRTTDNELYLDNIDELTRDRIDATLSNYKPTTPVLSGSDIIDMDKHELHVTVDDYRHLSDNVVSRTLSSYNQHIRDMESRGIEFSDPKYTFTPDTNGIHIDK